MKSLTLKYRPSDFETVCGQSVTTKILERVIIAGTFKNAILFEGASGCGKTTLARIFANKINNGQGSPIEIDAASNSGVENVRAIIAESKKSPYDSQYKVYIIDECHAISKEGWQAFLKGIEEPTESTIFIFCTTEPNKIPTTILNRVQRYRVSRISAAEIRERLKLICSIEGFVNYDDACDFISKIAGGGMRDAITYLEQCADYSVDLSMENVKAVLGDISTETMLRLTKAIIDKNEAKVFEIIDAMYNEGRDLKVFLDSYLAFILDLNKYILFKRLDVTSLPEYLKEPIDYLINFSNNVAWFNFMADVLLDAKTAIKYDLAYKSTIEVYLTKLCRA